MKVRVKKVKVHCLFEQSGTFKNEFKKLGYEAYDYDLQNEFGQTDYQIDLFAEIVGGVENKPSIFDSISQDDLILAFFPCIRFENQIMLLFRGQNHGQRNWSLEQKMLYDMNLLDELNTMYKYVNYLFLICIRRGLKLVMENPYSEEHFLRRYWCYLPAIIDRDRRENGDYFKKPTAYWFLNCEPQHGYTLQPRRDTKTVLDAKPNAKAGICSKERSEIAPEYAYNFICDQILGCNNKNERQLSLQF
jgi:hypothetical protein